MKTMEILRTQAAETMNGYSVLAIEPTDTTTQAVFEHITAVYPNMEKPTFDKDKIYITDNRNISFEDVRRTATEISAIISEVFGEETISKHYARYADNPNTLYEFDTIDNMITWLKYEDDFSKRHKFRNNNPLHIRIAATQTEVERVLYGDAYTYEYNPITDETIIEKV